MKIDGYSGKIEISADEGVTWTQVEPLPESEPVDFVKTWRKRIVFTGTYTSELKKALEKLIWGDRLN
jgi:hypothetical protein